MSEKARCLVCDVLMIPCRRTGDMCSYANTCVIQDDEDDLVYCNLHEQAGCCSSSCFEESYGYRHD